MRLSYKWLSEYVDLSGITPEELAANPDARKKYLGSNFDLRKAKLSVREDE